MVFAVLMHHKRAFATTRKNWLRVFEKWRPASEVTLVTLGTRGAIDRVLGRAYSGIGRVSFPVAGSTGETRPSRMTDQVTSQVTNQVTNNDRAGRILRRHHESEVAAALFGREDRRCCGGRWAILTWRRTLREFEIALRKLTRERFEAIIVDCAGPGSGCRAAKCADSAMQQAGHRGGNSRPRDWAAFSIRDRGTLHPV